MKLICTDNTQIDCAQFEVIDEGVLVYESESEKEEREATGFVPFSLLRYVLPERSQQRQQPGQAEPMTQIQERHTPGQTREQQLPSQRQPQRYLQGQQEQRQRRTENR